MLDGAGGGKDAVLAVLDGFPPPGYAFGFNGFAVFHYSFLCVVGGVLDLGGHITGGHKIGGF